MPSGYRKQPLSLSTWLLDASGFVLAAIGCLYGAFFVALGAIFLYWSVRGLLEYSKGVRTAPTDPMACAAGLVIAALSLWAGIRLLQRGVPPGGLNRSGVLPEELDATLEQAMKLERTDPAASQELLDSYFMREGAKTEQRRAALRERAPHDLGAAIQLRNELSEELSHSPLIRKDIVRHQAEDRRASLLKDIDESDNQLRTELNELNATIEHLKLR